MDILAIISQQPAAGAGKLEWFWPIRHESPCFICILTGTVPVQLYMYLYWYSWFPPIHEVSCIAFYIVNFNSGTHLGSKTTGFKKYLKSAGGSVRASQTWTSNAVPLRPCAIDSELCVGERGLPRRFSLCFTNFFYKNCIRLYNRFSQLDTTQAWRNERPAASSLQKTSFLCFWTLDFSKAPLGRDVTLFLIESWYFLSKANFDFIEQSISCLIKAQYLSFRA